MPRSNDHHLPSTSAHRAAAALVLAAALTLLPALAVPAAGGGAGTPASASPAAHRVNVNTAGVEELQTLPRIGPALARRIVEYRQKAGPFHRVEDLLAVRGIGPKLLERLRERVTVGMDDSARGAGRRR